MIHDVVSASYKDEYKIEVTFDDGSSGIVDFSVYLTRGGVFDRFKDMAFFKNFKINQDLGGPFMAGRDRYCPRDSLFRSDPNITSELDGT